MDTGRGYMEEIPEDIYRKQKQQPLSGVFAKGEIVEINGSRFKIKSIGKQEMKLKILRSETTEKLDMMSAKLKALDMGEMI